MALQLETADLVSKHIHSSLFSTRSNFLVHRSSGSKLLFDSCFDAKKVVLPGRHCKATAKLFSYYFWNNKIAVFSFQNHTCAPTLNGQSSPLTHPCTWFSGKTCKTLSLDAQDLFYQKNIHNIEKTRKKNTLFYRIFVWNKASISNNPVIEIYTFHKWHVSPYLWMKFAKYLSSRASGVECFYVISPTHENILINNIELEESEQWIQKWN